MSFKLFSLPVVIYQSLVSFDAAIMSLTNMVGKVNAPEAEIRDLVQNGVI